MKPYLVVCLLLATLTASAQSFKKDFVAAAITLNDSSKQTGVLKWSLHQNDKVRFRKGSDKEAIKYSPNDIKGFEVDTARYISLFNLSIYGDDYPLLGKMTTMKQAFARVIHQGTFNIYFVHYEGYSALTGMGSYLNFVFEKNNEFVAFPMLIRMRNNRFGKAKESLIKLFEAYPQVSEKIKALQQEDNFLNIIDDVKRL